MAASGARKRRFASVPRFVRVAVKVLLVVIVVAAVYLAVTAVQVWLTSRESDPQLSQAIIIMGAAQYNGVPSPDLLARLQEADTLYKRHLAPLVVATGAKEPGDHYTEAWTEATWLARNGVPPGDVVQVGGRTTWESLILAGAVLDHKGVKKVLIVTDGFHEDRCMAIATELGLEPKPAPATSSPIRGWSAFPYFMKETAAVALGRIIGYSHLEWLHGLG
jgi:uncharacterized SAM-binding protein YcdF (DUF218 family)